MSGVARPGEGTRHCPELTRMGTRCGNLEIEGLIYCLQHMPFEFLEEAEEITGLRRCRRGIGTPDYCRHLAVAGTEPPLCGDHGAALGSKMRTGVVTRQIEGSMMDRLAQIMTEGGEKLLRPDPVSDPLAEMLELAAEMKAGKELLRQVVAHLFTKSQHRYAHKNVGEQVRVELLLYERAVERFAKILIDISKMKIDERLAGIRQQTADMLERALDAALEKAGVGLEHKQEAKETYRKHLRIVA